MSGSCPPNFRSIRLGPNPKPNPNPNPKPNPTGSWVGPNSTQVPGRVPQGEGSVQSVVHYDVYSTIIIIIPFSHKRFSNFR